MQTANLYNLWFMKIRMKSAILEILDKNINSSQDKLGVEHKMVEWTKNKNRIIWNSTLSGNI